MKPVYFKPVMHIPDSDPLFDIVWEDLEFKIQTDPWLKKRVHFGSKDGKRYIDVTATWDRHGILNAPPLIAELEGSPRRWDFSIEILRDPLVVVYDSWGRIARPFFDGDITLRSGEEIRKRAYRLREGCWVVLINRKGKITRLQPYTSEDERREHISWAVDNVLIGYTDDPEQLYKLFSSAAPQEELQEEPQEERLSSEGYASKDKGDYGVDSGISPDGDEEDEDGEPFDWRTTLKDYRTENPLRWRRKPLPIKGQQVRRA